MTADTALGGHISRGVQTVYKHQFVFRISGIFLAILLVLVPVCRSSKVEAISIPSFVTGLFLAVCISMGLSFDLLGIDVTSWSDLVIGNFLNANGYNSIEEWLGASYQAETSISGSFLGITPNLFAKIKLAVDFGIQNGDIPTGGSEAAPVNKDIRPKYYLSDLTITNNITNNTQSFTNLPLVYVNDIASGGDLLNGFYQVNYLPTNYLYTFTYSTISGNASNTEFRLIDFTSNTIPGYTNLSTYADFFRFRTYSGNSVNSLVRPATYTQYPANSQYPIYCIPACSGSVNDMRFTLLFIYRATNGNYYYQANHDNPWSRIPVVVSDTNGKIISVGQPNYNFNNVDPIYIDLQLGNLLSSIQALIDLITAINNNLITATIAIQSNSPSDLPVDTTPYIDFVNYCNEETNLALSGYQSIAEAVGNMYVEMYDIMSETTSTNLLNAIINAYNAFINKLTLFQIMNGSSGGSGSLLEPVQDFQVDLSDIRDSYSSGSITSAQAISQASALLYSYVSDAASVEEIIGLNSAYQSFAEDLGLILDQSSNVNSVINGFNNIVDQYLNGTLDSQAALSSLLSTYKSALNSSKTVESVIAIISAYQVAVDRISLNAFSVDPEGIGTTVPEVIQQEDDLLQLLDQNDLRAILQFQQWSYLNTNESNLYREYFQKILDSTSPFYVFIYPCLVLGIVGIILGTHIKIHGKTTVRNPTSNKRGE